MSIFGVTVTLLTLAIGGMQQASAPPQTTASLPPPPPAPVNQSALPPPPPAPVNPPTPLRLPAQAAVSQPAPPRDVPAPKTPPDPTKLTGLLAYWSFEDETPTVRVVDQSGNGNDGRAPGAEVVDGIRGKALLLTAGTAAFDYSASPAFNFPPNGAFTLSVWVKTSSQAGALLSQRNSRDDGADIDLFLSGGKLQAHVRQDKGFFNVALDSRTAISDDRWHHCALVRWGNSAVVFVDGRQVGQDSGNEVAGSITTDMRYLCLERRWGQRGYMGVPGMLTAAVDEFCIFNRALDPEEIQTLAGRSSK